jgi:hypothetical protein
LYGKYDRKITAFKKIQIGKKLSFSMYIMFSFSLASNANASIGHAGTYPVRSTLTGKKKNLFFVCISYFLSL